MTLFPDILPRARPERRPGARHALAPGFAAGLWAAGIAVAPPADVGWPMAVSPALVLGGLALGMAFGRRLAARALVLLAGLAVLALAVVRLGADHPLYDGLTRAPALIVDGLARMGALPAAATPWIIDGLFLMLLLWVLGAALRGGASVPADEVSVELGSAGDPAAPAPRSRAMRFGAAALVALLVSYAVLRSGLFADPFADAMGGAVEAYRAGDAGQAMAKADLAVSLGERTTAPADALAGAYALRAILHRQDRALDLALSDIQRARDLDPRSVATLAEQARILHMRGEDRAAVVLFSQALRQEPDAPELLAGRAAAYRVLGEMTAARADIERAIALAPERRWYRFERGLWLFQEERFEAAAAAFEASLGDWFDLYAAAMLYVARARAGDPNGARARLRVIAAELDLERWYGPVIQLFLGQVGEGSVLARAREAPDPLRRRERLSEAWFYVGQWRLLSGDPDGARRAFRSAMAQEVVWFIEHGLSRATLDRMGDIRS